MSVTLHDICQLVGLQLGLGSVQESDRIIEDLGAESFDLLNLVSALEERYQVVFDDEDASAVETVADLFALVRSKVDGAGVSS